MTTEPENTTPEDENEEGGVETDGATAHKLPNGATAHAVPDGATAHATPDGATAHGEDG
jgi:hypothetical protein